MNRRLLWKGTFYCLIASVAWGGMFPVMGSALQRLDAFNLTWLRYTPMALILAAALLLVEGRRAFRFDRKILPLWFYGTMAVAGYNLLVFWAQYRLGMPGTILASIMESLMPMVSVPLLWLWKREKPRKFTVLCVGIALIGVLAVITKGNVQGFLLSGDSLWPTLVMFAGVIGWVIYTIGAGRFSDWSPLRYSALSILLGTLTVDVVVAGAMGLGFLAPPKLQVVWDLRRELFYTVAVSGAAAVFCWNAGVKLLKPINGMLFLNLVPVITFFISVIQGYQMGAYEVIGSALIIGALLLNNLYQRRGNGTLPKAGTREEIA